MDIPYTVQPRPDTGLYNAKVGIWLFLASEVMLFGALFSSYILLRVGASAENWPHWLLNIPIGTFNTAVLIVSSVTVVMSWASLKMGKVGQFKVFMALTVLCAFAFLGIKTFEYREKFMHYEVWLKEPLKIEGKQTDIDRLTGHAEHGRMFMTLETLVAEKKEVLEFHPDFADNLEQNHYSRWHRGQKPKDTGKGEELKIPVSQIKRLSAFVPAHSTYFAIYFTLTALHGLHVLAGAIVLAYFFFTADKMWKTQPERLTNRVEVGGLFWHFVDLVWIFLFPVLYLL